MAMGSGQQGAPLSEINVTPLVDVMLVLLIIFMITAPMMDKGVELDLPKAEAAPMEVDDSKLVMTIDKNRTVFLGDTPIAADRLEEVLTHNERLAREKELYLRADASVPYGFVVRVMALVKKAGIVKLGMITDPLGDAPKVPEGGATTEGEKGSLQ